MLKRFLKKNSILTSIALTAMKRQIIRISKDKDEDYEIKHKLGSFFSASPFAWFTKAEQELFEYNYVCSAGDTAIIIGVEDGHELLHYCKQCHPGKVFAIEPTKECVRRIFKMKKKNKLNNLVIIQAAIGSVDTDSISFTKCTSTGGDLTNTLATHCQIENAITVQVRMERLDSIIKSNSINHIAYMKINIEGAELDALKSLGEHASLVENICVSCHDFITPAMRTYDKVLGWLECNCFEIRNHIFTIERPWENYYLYGKRAGKK